MDTMDTTDTTCNDTLAKLADVLNNMTFPSGVTLCRNNETPYWHRVRADGTPIENEIDLMLSCDPFMMTFEIRLRDDRRTMQDRINTHAIKLASLRSRAIPEMDAITVLLTLANQVTLNPVSSYFLRDAATYLIDRTRQEGAPSAKMAIGNRDDHGQDPATWPLRRVA